jgi:large subunit ribosomal protein L11|uniref:Large ribosomal subunit protein uL11m n=1 Tax=Zea mays TaxID=4577 RepID=C4JA50_MAIZE|nr:unknown [Zea mays]
MSFSATALLASVTLFDGSSCYNADIRRPMATLKDAAARKSILATIRLVVPAGAARPAPPVGPALGFYRLNLMAFCKDFNARTQKYKAETPMQVTLTAYKDSTFEFVVKSPSVSWFLKKAAGIETASTRPSHVNVSSLTLRHVYEIAKLKQADPFCKHISLEALCKSIIGTANSMGIAIVKDL